MPRVRDERGRFVAGARQRRTGKTAAREVRIQWFTENVCSRVSISMLDRVRIATQMLKDQVVRNISTPVIKSIGPRGGRVVTGRSISGEYPHAETEQLLKTVFMVVQESSPEVWDGFVGTPLDYGLILEMKMNRKFLSRTLRESFGMIRSVLTGPIR